MNRTNRIQHLLVSHLLEEGQIQLNLPGGMMLELGTVSENRNGELEKVPDYCWLIAEQKDRTVSLDSYNLGIQYLDNSNKIIVENEKIDNDGNSVRIFTAV